MYGYEVRCEWARTVDPLQEPLSLDEAKLHCSITHQDDNPLIGAYLTAARQAAEQYMNRALFTQTWKLQLSYFADVIWLPMAAPLQTVTSVEYYDADGNLQTLSTTFYDVDTISEPGRVLRKPNQTYPSVQSDRERPVIVTYVCGWSDVANVPELIKQGMRRYVAAQDADRIGSTLDAVAARLAAEAEWHRAGTIYWRPPQCRWS